MARTDRNMTIIRQTIVVLLTANLLLGCSALGPIVRDDYMGKSLLQPQKMPLPVTHDDNGIPNTEGTGWSFPRLLPWPFNTN